VPKGEFFGIAGRNGSGKSTLLKLIAGIYHPDEGEISAVGRLAPVIELGVGFNPELPAYDNVVMNAMIAKATRMSSSTSPITAPRLRAKRFRKSIRPPRSGGRRSGTGCR